MKYEIDKTQDIEERSGDFGVRVIKMVREFPKDPASYVLGNQIIKSGTAIGANIVEARSALTRKEFIYSMNIAKKEARETFHWLTIIVKSGLVIEERMKLLIQKCNEIISILTTIVKRSQNTL